MSAQVPVFPSDATALPGSSALRYGAALCGCLVTALLCFPLAEHVDLANIVMLFLLNVVIIAVYAGHGPSVLASFASVAIFDVVFVPPRWTLAVEDVQYLLTFAIMLAVALTTASLTAGLRQQLQIAAARERDARALYASARELAGAVSATQTAGTLARATQSLFNADSVLLLPDSNEQLANTPSSADTGSRVATDPPPWVDRSIAAAVYRNAGHLDAADLGGLSAEDPPIHYRALRAPMRVRGVLAVRGHVPDDKRALLDAMASLSAIAVERLHYVDVAQRTEMQMNSDRLRHSLLAAVSHDLRTPLTALVGLADTLTLPSAALNPVALETAEAIRDQARELSTMVSNLLDMARLQTGRVSLRREWQPIEEVIGSSLQQLRLRLASHAVTIALQPGLPLINIDAVLMERVLCNLLDNAAKYSPPGSTIRIEARSSDQQLVIAVSDSGCGVAAADARRIFDVFERASQETSTIGAGLGLSIARSIVEAHGGMLRLVEQPVGARFEFTIPLGSPPVVEFEPGAVSTPT